MYKKIIISLTLVATIGLLALGVVDRGLASALKPGEAEGLLFMREEEKLAHDVYLTFYSLYGLPVFGKISQSEQCHTNAVKNLLDYYGLADPASNQVGVFTNSDLQSLYDTLIPWGSQSLSDALKAGGAVEEIDILDLDKYLSLTNKANIQRVYNHLLNGSYNHLRAFVSTLYNQTGEIYEPQYLPLERYQAIIGETRRGFHCGGRR